MALVLTNPTNATDDGFYEVPYCPQGAEVMSRSRTPIHIVDRQAYVLSRYDWGYYEHAAKHKAAYTVYGRATHTTATVHDLKTGQLVSIQRKVPFGTVDQQALESAKLEYFRKIKTRARRTQQCERLIEAIKDGEDTCEWDGDFRELYDATPSSGALQEHIEKLSTLDSTECGRGHCNARSFCVEDVLTARNRYSSWCPDCVDSSAQHIDDEGYVDSDEVVWVDNDSYCVTSWYAESNYYQNDDGDWYSEPPENDYDDDDDTTHTPELHSYHSTKNKLRGWTMPAEGRPIVTQGCWSPLTIGIELEVEAIDSRHDTVEPLVNDLRKIVGSQSLFAEEDGSLDAYKGFELIFGWSDLSSWQRTMPAIGGILKDGGVCSFDAGANYGLHVNVAVPKNYFVQSAITWFINNPQNNKLLYALARREPTTYCKRVAGDYKPSDSHFAAVNFGNTQGCFTQPHTATTFTDSDSHSTIASFRLFRGTTCPTRLLADIEFCHSLVSAATEYSYRWGNTTIATPSTLEQFSARYWQTHVLKNITRYPTLVNYLRSWDKTRANPNVLHYVFSDFVLTRFISQYPLGTFTGGLTHTLDKRALAVLSTSRRNQLQTAEE